MNEETLFELARNTPQAERAGLFDQHCVGNPALRARVEALLAADSAEHSPFDPAPQRTPDATATFGNREATNTFHPTSKDPEAGAILAGKYRLTERIGEGGMGSVWLAQQSEPVKRKVAVKLIKAGMDSKAVLARFEAERQALAVMDHPNIAKVLDGGLHDGRPYFVMELVKGVPITEYCDARKLTPQQRLELFVPVCQAIQHAHQKGIIHRDIKPSNVLIALYDDKPVPKVIDFGIAKATGGTLTEQTIETAFGGVVGTPQYMSPEQASLNNLDIDTRSDVYSLGVLLYELLTGSPPFSRKELEKKGLLEILRVVREEEPPKPSTKLSTADALPSLSANRSMEPKKLTGLLRNELDWIVMKALEKDRSRRYETANGFAADVNRYLSGEAVLAHPPSTAYRIGKFVKRNKVQVIAAGLVALALLAGVVGTSVGMTQARQANRELAVKNAALEAEQAKVEQRFEMARKSIATFHTVITDEKALENDAFKALRKKLLTQAAGFYRELETLLAGEADAKSRKALADGLFNLAWLTEKIGDKTQALASHEKARDIYQKLAEADPASTKHQSDLADSHHAVGNILSDTGKPADGLASQQKARDIRQKLVDANPAVTAYQSDLAASHYAIGIVLSATGKPADALASHEKARDIRQKLVDANPASTKHQSDLAASHISIGVELSQTGKPTDALASHEKARDIYQKLAEADPASTKHQSDLAASHDNIGFLLSETGKPAEAFASYEKARDLQQKLADANPAVTQYQSDLAASHYIIGLLLSQTGKPAEALASYEKARDIYQKVADGNPAVTQYQSELAAIFKSIGTVLSATGKPADALASFEKARDIRKKLADANPAVTSYQSDLADSHNNIGAVLSATGRPGEALASIEKARDINQKLADANPTFLAYRSSLAISHYNVACWYAVASGKHADKPDKAKAEADKAMDSLRKAVSAGFNEVAHMKKDTELDSLRGREDFKKLLAELEKAAVKPPEKK